MRKFRRGEETVTVIIPVECEVVCQCSPGRREVGPSIHGPGEPAEDPTVEILSIISMRGTDISGVVDELDRETLKEIEEAALAAAGEREIAAMEAAADMRADEARDLRLHGEDY